MAKRKLTLSEHYQLGIQLKIVGDLLSLVAKSVFETQSKASKATRKLLKAKEELSSLKSALDNIACAEHLDRDNGAEKAYYGSICQRFELESGTIKTITDAAPVTLILKRGDETLFITELK